VAGQTEPRTIRGDADVETPTRKPLGRYVFEPHAAVLAADLTGLGQPAFAAVRVAGIPYLTGDRNLTDPALSCFEVTEVLPLDPKHLREAIRERAIGILEVKKRGVKIDPEEVRTQIHPRGDNAATLIITPVKKKVSPFWHNVSARPIPDAELRADTEKRPVPAAARGPRCAADRSSPRRRRPTTANGCRLGRGSGRVPPGDQTPSRPCNTASCTRRCGPTIRSFGSTRAMPPFQ